MVLSTNKQKAFDSHVEGKQLPGNNGLANNPGCKRNGDTG